MSLKREPTLIIASIASILSLVAGFGLDFLSTEQAGLISAALTALLGVWNSLRVRPVAPTAWTYAAGVIATLLATYGLDISQEQVSLVNATILAILALILRGDVTPVTPGVSAR